MPTDPNRRKYFRPWKIKQHFLQKLKKKEKGGVGFPPSILAGSTKVKITTEISRASVIYFSLFFMTTSKKMSSTAMNILPGELFTYHWAVSINLLTFHW